VEVAARESKAFEVDDRHFQMVLQCRVRPEALRLANNAVFIVRESDDIRPYGILLFEVKGE